MNLKHGKTYTRITKFIFFVTRVCIKSVDPTKFFKVTGPEWGLGNVVRHPHPKSTVIKNFEGPLRLHAGSNSRSHGMLQRELLHSVRKENTVN